jgi:hypothetical protein
MESTTSAFKLVHLSVRMEVICFALQVCEATIRTAVFALYRVLGQIGKRA